MSRTYYHGKYSARAMAKLPKVPRQYIRDTKWGHAMWRIKYHKVVMKRARMLRDLSDGCHFVWKFNPYSRNFWMDTK